MNIKTHIITSICTFIAITFTTIAAAQSDWVVNPADFQYTMTITGTGSFNCVEISDSNDKVAAFVGDECRGVANFDTEVNGSFLAYLTIYSNSVEGAELSFKLYNAATNTITDSPQSGIFSDGDIIGNPEEPYSFLTEYGVSSIYIPGDSLVSSYEIGTTVSELFLINEGGDTLSGSFEFIDDEIGPDNFQFSIQSGYLILMNLLVPGVQNSLQIHIQGTTDGGCSIDEVVFLEVINNNIPPIGLLVDSVQVAENLPLMSLVMVLVADDESVDDSHSFEFFEGDFPNPDQSSFIINDLDLLTDEVLDYETQVWYSLSILITDEAGNTAIDTLWVEVLDEIEFDDLKVSNLITPNDDGYNDTFAIPNVELFYNYELIIYNAQGAVLYTTTAYDNSWNGVAKNGTALPSATYYYIFRDKSQQSDAFQGEIHIYRNNKF